MLKEFFGIGGYQRQPEGYLSWQHLTFVTVLLAVLIIAAVWLGRKFRDTDKKNKPLIFAAIAIDGLEIFKIVLFCIIEKDWMSWRGSLPLFLCSIQLITIPLAAFSKGRVKEASMDFVSIFGMLGAVLGTYAAAQNYNAYPVLSFTNVVSGLTHGISGFAAVYIGVSGQLSLKKKNIFITVIILLSFAAAAFGANHINYPDYQHNYMFLRQGDGTPYDILYNLVGGHPVWYPIGVVALFLLYIFAFYGVYYLVKGKKKENAAVS